MRNHLFKRITAMAMAGFMALSLHSPVLADDFFQESPDEEIVVELDESGMDGSEVDISLDESETVDLTEETEENTDFFTDETVDNTEETIDLTEESDGTERIEGDLVSDNIDGEMDALGEEPVETENAELVTDEVVDLTEEAVDLTASLMSAGGMGGIQARSGGVATLVTGMTFSERLKKLAGNDGATMQSADSAITSVIRTNEPFTAEGDGIISASDSAFPIYARFDNGTIYIYTDAETIATPANLENMFDNMTALTNTNLFEGGIDTSATQKTNYAFRNCTSLGSLNFSGVIFGNVVDMKDMFLNTGLSEITFGSGFRFGSATSLNKNVNWAAPNGNIYNTYMLETTSSLPEKVTATGDAPNQSYERDNLYYGTQNVLAGNNLMRLSDGEKFTAYCINKKRGEVYGYYEKVGALDDSGNVSPSFLDSNKIYAGGSPMGNNLAEALITMLYYGEKDVDAAGSSGEKMAARNSLQEAVWHFTDEYEGIGDFESWANLAFNDIPGKDNSELYVYRNLSGRQNAIGVDCVVLPEPAPEPTIYPVSFEKQTTDGQILAGANLSLYRADESGTPAGNSLGSWTSSAGGDSLRVIPGRYVIVETGAPAGYQTAANIVFAVADDGTVTSDALTDGKLVMIDEPIPVTGKVRISKQDVAGKEIPGAVLKVYETANPENIIDSWTSAEDTTHEIESVPAGEYTLEETTAPGGYIKAESITFSVDSDGKVTCGSMDSDGRIVMTDEIITVSISKQDIAGAEIEGAELKIYNANKEVVEEWTSAANNTHIVEGLAAGEYTLVETTAPDGFQKAESIAFTVAEDGSVTVGGQGTEKIIMTDAPSEVSISKQNIAGEEIEGAVLIIQDKNGTEKTRWTSAAGKTHIVYGLTAGEYTLIEETAPNGYVKAESISFKLNRDGTVECNDLDENGNIVMTDEYLSKTVVISKQDIAGAELPGATLVVKDADGAEVKSWISGETPTEIEGLGVGTYTLTETTAPDGYLKAETIEFTVRADGAVTSKNMKNGKIVMTDKPTEVVISKRDVAGSEIEGAHISIYDIFDEEVESWVSSASESHTVKGLKAGTYRLVETQAPDGYVIAEEITFTLDTEGKLTSKNLENGKIVMVDNYAPKNVVISKQDIAGKEIAGAELKVTNSKGEEIDKWTSVEGKSHPIEDLEEGTYTLTEITAPKGYEIAESISFTIKKDGTVDSDALIGSKIVMKDKYTEHSVKIRKVDGSAKFLAGAELSVTNAAGKEVAAWTSKDGEDYEVKGLVPGSYVIVEKKAPAGFAVAKAIRFEIALDGKVTCTAMNADGIIIVTNEAREYPVKIRKADIAGDEIPGAKLTITDAEGKEVKSWTSEADKVHSVTLLPGSYTLTEVTAPDGYEKAEAIAFTVDKDGKVASSNLDADGNILMTDAYSTSSVAIKKTDINGTMIAGAKMQIVHSEGGKDVVDAEWTTAAGESYIAKNLKAGTYILKETEAPAGYVKAEDITFTVAADGTVKVGTETVTAVTMVDKFGEREVVISKQNIAGEEIPGAKIVITDKDKKTVDSWTSEAGKSHTFKALPGTYTLTETQAPNGYEVAESIEFTIGTDGKATVGGSTVSKVVMVDKYSQVPVVFRKVQIVDGKEQLLAGASMQVYHAFNGKKVVDAAWNTTANEKAVNLDPGTYVYNELSAPAGFDLAPDITFIVSADRTISIIQKVKDANGNTVQRAYKQDGLTITMVDSVQDNKFDVLIEKLDRDGVRLAGAILDVSRKESENVTLLDSWTTKADADQVMRLSAGSYVLHETTPPAGFVRAADIEFIVGDKGEIKVGDQVLSKISMYDDMTKVSITKQDESGKGLAGASLQILDANKQVVDSWTSTTGTRTFTGILAAGQTYTLHETAAPNGYQIAADITFTVREDGQEQVIVMKDSKGDGKSSEKNSTTPDGTTPNGTTPANNNSNNAQNPGTTGNLRVNKNVAGEGADQTKKFGFIVTLTQNGKPLEGTYVMNLMGTEGRITFNAAGQAGFELSHGQSMVIYNIPVNVNYTVQELDYTAEGYTATVSGSGDGKGVSSGDNVVTFTNTFGAAQATGNAATTAVNQPSYTSTISRATGDDSHMMFWIMGIAAAAVAAGFIARKRLAAR